MSKLEMIMYDKIRWFDAAEPRRLAEFWAMAGVPLQPPPDGYPTWEEFARVVGLAEDRLGDQAAVIDPDDEGPRISFQRVPEGKTAKNRVHLDTRVAGPELTGEPREPCHKGSSCGAADRDQAALRS